MILEQVDVSHLIDCSWWDRRRTYPGHWSEYRYTLSVRRYWPSASLIPSEFLRVAQAVAPKFRPRIMYLVHWDRGYTEEGDGHAHDIDTVIACLDAACIEVEGTVNRIKAGHAILVPRTVYHRVLENNGPYRRNMVFREGGLNDST